MLYCGTRSILLAFFHQISIYRALQESLLYSCATQTSPDEEDNSRSDSIDENVELALRLSRAEKLKENELLMEENRMIEMAIKLSLEES